MRSARDRSVCDGRRDAQPVPDDEHAVDLGPLDDFIGYVLRRAWLRVSADFQAALREVDLKPTQFTVLLIIGRNAGLSQSEVCSALGIQKTNFVPLLNELVRRGLAERRPAASDRRSHALHLTPEGEALLERAMTLHAALEERLTARVGKRGREKLIELLRRLSRTD